MSPSHRDTIFALSSGLPPAAIAVVRVSGAEAGPVLERLTGGRPAPRRATVKTHRDPRTGEIVDEGLVLWFPGPASATGEDLAEFHVHGGRAVVAAILDVLSVQPRCREAHAGEFTRRAFENGRIDLAQAEGLADLIEAETEEQRRAALALSEGGLGALVERWTAQLLAVSARVEASLDFSDEEDGKDDVDFYAPLRELADELGDWLTRPPAERLKDGLRIVVAGPPNAGKSSLINALSGRQAALVTDIAGTTRDRVEVPVRLDGVPLLFIDTAGLRESSDTVEKLGIALAKAALAEADLVLWLGAEEHQPDRSILVLSKSDARTGPGLPVSVRTGDGLDRLRVEILNRAHTLLPSPGTLALNHRHRTAIHACRQQIGLARAHDDPLIVAEHLRAARRELHSVVGGITTEDVLTTLFGRLCIGK